MIVCLCMVSTHEDIAGAIADGAHTTEQVGERCGAGTGCGTCKEYIAEMIEKSGASCGGDCRDCPGSRRAGSGLQTREPAPESREAA